MTGSVEVFVEQSGDVVVDVSPVGSKGDIGIGIKSIVFDEVTGRWTVTLTNDVEYETESVTEALETYESNAAASASAAATQAGVATTQAGIATTRAGEAAASASTATTQAGIATGAAGTATTQAGIATTQAGVATTKAGEAAASESTATTKAGEASTSAELSQAWAEGTEPGGPGTKSAQEHAAAAGVSETNAATSAAQAALYDGVWLDDVAAIKLDETLSYGPGASGVAEGDYVRTRAEGFSYQVAASGATDHHLTTAGGVKLKVLPGEDGYYSADALGTIDAAKLQALSDSMSGGDIIRVSNDFSLSSGVTFSEGVGFLMDGLCTFSGTAPAFTFGSDDSFTQLYQVPYRTKLKRATDSDFSSLSDIGVEFINITNCPIDLARITGFTICCKVRGGGAAGRGFVWNDVRVGLINNYLIGIDINASALGFTNEVQWHGGHFDQRNSVATSATTHADFVSGGEIIHYCFRLIGVNSHAFFKPAIETSWTRSGDSQVFKGRGFYLDDARYNAVYAARFESSDTLAFLTGDSQGNLFEVLYDEGSNRATIIDESDRRANYLKSLSYHLEEEHKGSWQSEPLHKIALDWNSGSIAIPGMSFQQTAAGYWDRFSFCLCPTGYINPKKFCAQKGCCLWLWG